MKTLRILHVEDSPDDAELVGLALRAAPFAAELKRTETEEDFVAGLEGPPEVVLCDYDLPRFSAERALALLHERDLHIPFIIVSNHIGQNEAVVAMQQGAWDYVSKSDLGRLCKAIEIAMDRARGRQEQAQAERALRRSDATLRAVLHSLTQGIAVLDDEGTIVVVNRRWDELDAEGVVVGMGEAQPGRNYLEALEAAERRGDPNARQWIEGIGAVMMRTLHDFHFQYGVRIATGERWYSGRASPLEGTGHGTVVTHRDITARMMVELEKLPA